MTTERKLGEPDTAFLRHVAQAHIGAAEAANQYWHHYQKQREPWRKMTTDREDYSQTLYEWDQVMKAADELDELRNASQPRNTLLTNSEDE